MKESTAELLFNVNNELGEGPLWHPLEKRLYWVDILGMDLYWSSQDLESFQKRNFNKPIGAFGFKQDGGFILATGNGFATWEKEQNEPEPLWNPLPGRQAVRMNDGKVDPAGRFWAGSMDTTRQEAKLYRLDPDGSQHTLLENIGISNGIDWSPDHTKMYYTDSFEYTIYVFDYDLATGNIRNRQIFVRLLRTPDAIVPDGLCVDSEGCVWSAQWNGWQVVRYDPHGKPIQSINVPAQRVTSCCFGGENNDKLFITTSRADLPPQALANQPNAGDVFFYPTSTRGQVTNLFNS